MQQEHWPRADAHTTALLYWSCFHATGEDKVEAPPVKARQRVSMDLHLNSVNLHANPGLRGTHTVSIGV